MDLRLLQDTLGDLDRDLLERDVPVRLMLLAALAGEHVLLVGPPGTAKSELARRLHAAFADARYFERLLTRFSVPEELFGPLSLKALEQDRYERLIDGFLPTAQVAFLDEVFKANSAILNALLTLLNEREFDNGAGRIPVPLVTVVGATNDVPQDESLLAFHDRFLLRVPVQPVAEGNFAALLALPAVSQPAVARLHTGMLAPLRAAAADVVLPDPVLALLAQARAWCDAQSATVSDRRWRKLVALLKVEAASRGAHQVDAWDLWLLPYVLATTPAQVQAMVAWFDDTVARARALDLQWLQTAAQAFDKQLDIESAATTGSPQDDAAGKLALARAISGREPEDTQMVRLVSEHTRRRFSPVHVRARVTQLGEVVARARATVAATQATAQDVTVGMDSCSWLPPSWHARVGGVLRDNETRASELLHELERLQEAFGELPVDPDMVAATPEPVAFAAA